MLLGGATAKRTVAPFTWRAFARPTKETSSMAFADPQVVNIATVDHSLPRIAFGNGTGAFADADQSTKLSFSHSYGKRNRSVARLDLRKVASDPLLAGVNVQASMAAYFVIDSPITGFSTTEIHENAYGLVSYLQVSSSVKLLQLISGQS